MVEPGRAQEVVDKFVSARNELNDFFDLIVRKYIDIEVMLGNMTKLDSEQDFAFDEEESQMGLFAFSSEDFVETSGYGRRDQHFGATIWISQAFIDDPEKFRNDAVKKVAEQKLAEAERTKQNRLKRIEQMEKDLSKMKQAVDG